MEKPVVTSPQFWPFASDGVCQSFQYFDVVDLVDCGALRRVLVVNNILRIKKTVSTTLTFDRTGRASLGLGDV